jgi:hypothetical protein
VKAIKPPAAIANSAYNILANVRFMMPPLRFPVERLQLAGCWPFAYRRSGTSNTRF